MLVSEFGLQTSSQSAAMSRYGRLGYAHGVWSSKVGFGRRGQRLGIVATTINLGKHEPSEFALAVEPT